VISLDAAIDEEVRSARILRETVHDCVARMRRERLDQLHDLSQMLRSPRLTPEQRQRLCAIAQRHARG
jgi:transposase